jgi:hypothetical protein
MALQIYAVLLLGFYLLGMIEYAEKKKWTSLIGTGINVILWMPFVGRSLGWW